MQCLCGFPLTYSVWGSLSFFEFFTNIFIDDAITVFPILPPLSPLHPASQPPSIFPHLVHVHGLYTSVQAHEL